jgi:hypothetical protein
VDLVSGAPVADRVAGDEQCGGNIGGDGVDVQTGRRLKPDNPAEGFSSIWRKRQVGVNLLEKAPHTMRTYIV